MKKATTKTDNDKANGDHEKKAEGDRFKGKGDTTPGIS
jgi:hypothetical protein